MTNAVHPVPNVEKAQKINTWVCDDAECGCSEILIVMGTNDKVTMQIALEPDHAEELANHILRQVEKVKCRLVSLDRTLT